MLKMAIFGSGSGSNAQAIIDAIEAGQLNAQVTCILSDEKEAFILERARKHNIPDFYIDCAPFRTKLDGDAEQRVLEILEQNEVNLVVLAGFMRIVKKGLLEKYKGHIINIHPSLLPSFPGLEAGRQAFEYGVRFTGCTVHFVDEGVDTGAIITQRCVEITPDDTPESLMQKIHKQEHIAYPKALQWLAEGRIQRKNRRIQIIPPAQ